MTAMRIGEIAKRSGIGIETIRYYEREELLEEPQRRPSGYRQYDESTLARLEYIRRAKELGFTLSEIRELLELSFASQTCCDHVRQRAETKLNDIEDKIRSLQKMRRALTAILERCQANGSTKDCPLVHTTKRKRT
ncbi:MAG: MerR family transcriptional regulator [Planctomycetaceae bacterium]